MGSLSPFPHDSSMAGSSDRAAVHGGSNASYSSAGRTNRPSLLDKVLQDFREKAVMANDEESTALKGRIDRLEGQLDTLKVVRPMTITIVSLALAVATFAFAGLYFQMTQISNRIDRLESRVDALPQKLSDEFRAMRADMNAQTSAIASSITAARQVQPQILMLPSPLVPPQTP